MIVDSRDICRSKREVNGTFSPCENRCAERPHVWRIGEQAQPACARSRAVRCSPDVLICGRSPPAHRSDDQKSPRRMRKRAIASPLPSLSLSKCPPIWVGLRAALLGVATAGVGRERGFHPLDRPGGDRACAPSGTAHRLGHGLDSCDVLSNPLNHACLCTRAGVHLARASEGLNRLADTLV